jgi:hypothetical protein
VRFTVRQRVNAPCQQVVAAFADPAFYARLGAVPNIGAPEVLSCDDDGRVARLRLRYKFTGHLAPAARRVLDPDRMTWVDETVLDRGDARLSFHMVPDHYRDRLECRGISYFFPQSDGTTEQRVEGDVTVHFPLVARVVERALVSGLTEHLEQEATVLEEFLNPSGGRA